MVLHLKYRPNNLDEVIGQSLTVSVLRNAIMTNKLANAYLLTGSRGLGKTSLARILAKTINCENRIGYVACDTCDSCLQIRIGNHVDVLELDAASRTGVDDVRQIIENAGYVPVALKYKVYILDEVHMLSNSAFNALLKTLEEPPPRVKFIFATTEWRKVPATIVSRCQNFYLNRVTPNVLADHMAGVLANESRCDFDKDALHVIANASSGSVRDALSMLEQLITLCSDVKITKSDALRVLCLPEDQVVKDLLQLVLRKDCRGAISLVEKYYYTGGRSMAALFGQILQTIHNLLVEHANEDDAILSSLTRLWELGMKAMEDIHRAPNELQAAHIGVTRMALLADIKGGFSKLESMNPECSYNSIDDSSYALMTEILKQASLQKCPMMHFYLSNCVNMLSLRQGYIELSADAPIDDILAFMRKFIGGHWNVVAKQSVSFANYVQIHGNRCAQAIKDLVNKSDVLSGLVNELGLRVDSDLSLILN